MILKLSPKISRVYYFKILKLLFNNMTSFIIKCEPCEDLQALNETTKLRIVSLEVLSASLEVLSRHNRSTDTSFTPRWLAFFVSRHSQPGSILLRVFRFGFFRTKCDYFKKRRHLTSLFTVFLSFPTFFLCQPCCCPYFCRWICSMSLFYVF